MTTCFFTQNLLSDYVEGMLPSARHEELKSHLAGCRQCSDVQRDLQRTVEVMKTLPPQPIPPELSLRMTEAAAAGRRPSFSRAVVSRLVLFVAVPILLFGAAVVTFPHLFPWAHLADAPDESQFVRYFPLQQGAVEIVEEQSNWLHIREPMMRSLWEEGGLSPEEFEKSFQGKTGKAATPAKAAPPAPEEDAEEE